jgi:hypothetical protein
VKYSKLASWLVATPKVDALKKIEGCAAVEVT